jgi:hypothetical protein
MPRTCCCVPGCRNRGGHEFPSDINRRKSWIIAIRRAENEQGGLWIPTDTSVVCSSHFVASDYETVTKTGYNRTRKYLKKTAVPSQFAWNVSATAKVLARKRRYDARVGNQLLINEEWETTDIPAAVDDIAFVEEINSEAASGIEVANQDVVSLVVNAARQTKSEVDETSDKSDNGCQTVSAYGRTTIDDFRHNDKSVKHYTGPENCDVFYDGLSSLDQLHTK